MGIKVEMNQVLELEKTCVPWRRMLVFDQKGPSKGCRFEDLTEE
jgi:hypothetical protein